MKKKSLFKNNLQMVIYLIVFAICIALFIIIGKTDFKKDIDTDAKQIHSLYDLLDDENVYKFCDVTDVSDILNGRSGVILMGFPGNKWTNYTADILNDVATNTGIKDICYYDFKKDREESNGTYETVVNKLSVYVPVDDEGFQDIQAPTVVVVKDGEVLAYFDDTSIIKGGVTPEIYYSENQKALISESYKTALLEYIK